MKSIRIFAILALLSCLIYSCLSSRNTSGEEGKKRKKITGVTPGIKNPSRGVINASGDGLTPGIGQSNGAGSEENAASIANNAIARANALVKINPQQLAALTDEELLNRMVLSQQTEVQLSGGAQRRTANVKIAAYATMILNDHTQLKSELKKLAAGNIGLETSTTSEGLSGTDLQFVQKMIASNQGMIALYTAAGKAKDQAIREFALKNLPVLRKHLEAAQELTKSVKP
ncbi:DUF4142 domain-containing protein [Pedobacter heparinus]|uniref:DUF4142 domain-containing protein n=1 Tax=Pedobacter heparinus TaxID=984 RepID=UPI002931BDD9|nr:DUF4142 domain-containing protein [Pedobacter heparinus]